MSSEIFMHRALAIAANGLGRVAPNPMVGAVLVRNGDIIAEGYHRAHGLPHAEVEAIGKVRDRELLRECTLYVSLEPCSHFGKTPPCADLIIASQIPRVVVATADPFAKVNGEGIRRLREAGIEVELGMCEAEARAQNRRFFTFHERHRPYVILKWAQSADGFIDAQRTSGAAPARISGDESHRLSHKWRTEEQAIMVGANTALLDNPQLTARLWCGRNPLRVVVDSRGNLPRTLQLFDSAAPTLSLASDKVDEWLHELHARSIQSVLVEGGAKLLQRFADTGLWDEARIFTAPHNLRQGVKAPRVEGKVVSLDKVGVDKVTVLLRLP